MHADTAPVCIKSLCACDIVIETRSLSSHCLEDVLHDHSSETVPMCSAHADPTIIKFHDNRRARQHSRSWRQDQYIFNEVIMVQTVVELLLKATIEYRLCFIWLSFQVWHIYWIFPPNSNEKTLSKDLLFGGHSL